MKRRLLIQGACASAAASLVGCGGGGSTPGAGAQPQSAATSPESTTTAVVTQPEVPLDVGPSLTAGPRPTAPVAVGALTFAVEFSDASAALLQPQGGRFNPYYVYYGGDVQPDGPAGYRCWDGELQAYTTAGYGPAAFAPFSVANGALSIHAQPAPAGAPRPYVSGCLETSLGTFQDAPAVRAARPGFEQKYGYWEIRARVPRAKGIWPAFWLNGGKPGPADEPGEIDIFEMIGDGVVYQSAHDRWSATHVIESTGISPAFDHAGDFHAYGLSWTSSAITWYIDGAATFSASEALVARYRDLCGPMFLVMNIAVGGAWAGSPDPALAWPQVMDVDYVRSWAAGA
ncbi:glycoside hydrolase family 16 protein [Ramlibacter sp. MMS24-I3-19]|uniref:glycoside hydrolase family 16 protein n=1 Tax=Ramlibacter sp. MMS24-I3-19 TaxID=3416606 RepID=UPI003CFD8C7A